ncbi:MAG: hypothetical protein ACLSAP_02290 [Oscillospiraceae bacterium]
MDADGGVQAVGAGTAVITAAGQLGLLHRNGYGGAAVDFA